MTRRTSFLARAGSFLAVLGAANAIAGAVEARRTPQVRDLETLGISPEAFKSIRL